MGYTDLISTPDAGKKAERLKMSHQINDEHHVLLVVSNLCLQANDSQR